MHYIILALFMLISFCSVNAADSQEEFTVSDVFTIRDELSKQDADRLKIPADDAVQIEEANDQGHVISDEQIDVSFSGLPKSLRDKFDNNPCRICHALLTGNWSEQLAACDDAEREKKLKALVGLCVLIQSKCQQESKMAK